MSLTDTSELLHSSLMAILTTWGTKFDGESEPLYWLLRAQEASIAGGDVAAVLAEVKDPKLKADVGTLLDKSASYWADVRYSTLEPVTRLWGTVVNSMRVAADTGRATEAQHEIFRFSPSSVLSFFRSAWDRMEVADGLYHVFRAMPAPECQAMAALLNVHVDARIDEELMCRVIRLLDHEGPMTADETAALDLLNNTDLIFATFSGLRGHA